MQHLFQFIALEGQVVVFVNKVAKIVMSKRDLFGKFRIKNYDRTNQFSK